MSIHEETTVVAERPMMAVMNNLVLFDQHVKQNSLQPIVPELATDWVWDEDGTKLVFHLRQGVKWHDGKPFTAADVKCTWDLIQGKRPSGCASIRARPGTRNLSEVVPNGEYEVTFVLKRPQPAFLALLAGGHVAGLPVPRLAGANASASDRHRPVQIRRVPAQRVHQGGEEPGLLEDGRASSRRDRIHDHAQQPVDRDPRLCRRQVRIDLRRHADHSADPRSAEATARCHLRDAARQRQHQPDHQPREAALQ